MRGAIIHGPRHVRVQERPDPTILEPTDAVVRTVAKWGCGSDLWRYRGIAPVPEPTPIGHEYLGRVLDLTLPLEQTPEAYAAMDERRSIKTLLRP